MTTVPPLPDGPYDLILSDPPWQWKARSAKGEGRSAKRHYPVMDLADIHALGAEVQRVAAKDCALFLWVTMPMLPQGLATMAAWGFRFSTCAFTWAKAQEVAESELPAMGIVAQFLRVRRRVGWQMVKPQLGTGYWTRANAELCLLGTRGHPKRVDSGVPQLILAPRREHSRKPEETYERIERLMGGWIESKRTYGVTGSLAAGRANAHYESESRPIRRLEMFSRETRPGWDVWGLETGKFDAV